MINFTQSHVVVSFCTCELDQLGTLFISCIKITKFLTTLDPIVSVYIRYCSPSSFLENVFMFYVTILLNDALILSFSAEHRAGCALTLVRSSMTSGSRPRISET